MIHLNFTVPKGKVSDIMKTVSLLQSKFSNVQLEITAVEGSITEQEYEDKVKETFRQLGSEVKE